MNVVISAEEAKKLGKEWKKVKWPIRQLTDSVVRNFREQTVDVCEICHGDRFICVENVDDEVLQKCKCISQFNRLCSLYSSGIPRLFHNFKLSDYEEPLLSQNKSSINQIKDFTRRFDDYKQKGLGLLMSGPSGTGKTSIASVVGKVLLREGYSVLYSKMRPFINRSFEALNDSYELDRLRTLVKEVDLIIIDEVDKYHDSGNTMIEGFIESVFGTRYENIGPLIVIGNADREHLNLPDFILDRFEEVLIDVPFIGESCRKKQTKKQEVMEAALID